MKAILVTSRKGGVGKTTLSSRLGDALVRCGEKVLMFDCDFGVRCLDIVTGTTDKVLFDLYDITAGRASIYNAIVEVDDTEGRLSLVASPTGGIPTSDRFADAIDSLNDSYTTLIFDTPRDSLDVVCDVIKRSSLIDKTTAIVVTGTSDMSLRAAELTGNDLYDHGFEDVRLVMNFFIPDEIKKGRQLSPTEAIDRTAIPLLGMVPYDKRLESAQNNGSLSMCEKNTSCALSNIAERLCGKNVPLMSGFKAVKRTKIVNA